MRIRSVTKQSWWILGITALLTALCLGYYGWGAQYLKLKETEPSTTLTTTSTKPVYTEAQFKKTLQKYKAFDAFARVTTVEDIEAGKSSLGGYSDFPIMPGTNATQSISVQDGTVEMCTTMTPQGVVVAGKYLITSAYDHDGFHNSVLYVSDAKTGKYIKTVVLKGTPHVGGVSYDPRNQLVWVCSRRNNQSELVSITMKAIEGYDLNKTEKPVAYHQRALLGSITRASFVTYDSGKLYVGFFNPRQTGNIQHYNLSKTGKLIGASSVKVGNNVLETLSNAVLRQDILTQVQGMAFYKNYIILSQSYGPGRSRLWIFDNRNRTVYREKDALARFYAPSHLEQISTNGDTLWANFESSARAYRKTSHDHVDRLVHMNLKTFKAIVDAELAQEGDSKK
ncbi:YncE family protein [Schleiferilactobacillus perolens]|uniref:YncE family protein n=1 Tax=Schleiferilactobacillus perolens TaxID=100468 RepID=UPI0023576FC3|nr:hypothetical protein [Schleiferilactobacillus perolens]MCI2171526.1 hypothetical protein [Schleiferilactobacillus perolens]